VTTCAERSGFLFAHDCDQPAFAACDTCGKGICALHQRFVDARSVCVTCLRDVQAGRGPTPEQQDPTAATAAVAAGAAGSRPPYNRDEDPYFWTDTHNPGWSTWNDSDRRAFDRPVAEVEHSSSGASGDFDAS
jgi:hypothetical protein